MANPLAHNMRVAGFDAMGRVVTFTCFASAYDRFSPSENGAECEEGQQQSQPGCMSIIMQFAHLLAQGSI